MTHNSEEKFGTLIRLVEKCIICNNDQVMAEKRRINSSFLGWHRGIMLLIASHTDAHSALEKREVQFLGENSISRLKRS